MVAPGGAGLFHFADEGGDDVGSLQVEVVARAIEIDRQQVDEVAAVLLPVGLGLHQEHFFGQAIRGIGFFGVAVPEVVFLEGHGGVFGIGADGADDDDFFCARAPGGLQQGDAHDGVGVEEPAGVFPVGADAAADGGQMDEDVGPGVGQQALAVLRAGEIIVSGARDGDVARTATAEFFLHKGAKEAGAAGEGDAFVVPEGGHASFSYQL